MSTTATPIETIRTMGTIRFWNSVSAWGLIESEGRLFYAHRRHFRCDCGRGTLRMSEIQVGIKVEFSTVQGAAHRGQFPPATDIRVKE
jgi:cold shock CspA family protein